MSEYADKLDKIIKELKTLGDPVVEEYQRGLHDAWDIAKKIILPLEDGGISTDAIINIFGGSDSSVINRIFKDSSIDECLRKIRRYEAEQDKIKRSNCIYCYGDMLCSNPEFEDAEICISNCKYFKEKDSQE